MEFHDIAIIGGGASGLAAAVAAAKELKSANKAARIVVLEGNKKLGKKLLATGNGRCNLTNMNATTEHYFGDIKFAAKLFEDFTPEKIRDYFMDIGLFTTADSEGRVYPYNKQAAAVLEVLRLAASGMGVEFTTEFNVASVSKVGKNYTVISEDGKEIKVAKCILATGGKASPKLLSATNGYDIAASLGHSSTGLYPVLLQLKSGDKFLKNLSGMRCKADITLIADGEDIHSESGELLFADKSISGICIFGLSIYAGEFYATGKINGKKYRELSVKADLAPEYSYERIVSYINSRIAETPELPAGDILCGLLNMKVGREIIRKCGIDTLAAAKSIRREKVPQIAKAVKGLIIPINGTKDWDDAQVTAGGIPLREININTMESRVSQGLYLCGELLNIHGECGGFNLHWAWLSGIKAGTSAAKYLKGK